jgi:uncharacterized protein involved in exopolysaccharide biosynthesis
MIPKSEYSENFSSINLLAFLYKWRKALLLITVSSTCIAFVVSYLIEPKYKSTVTLLPATTASISKSLLSENLGEKEDFLQFGDEEKAEQMLQLLNSDEIRTRICEKYKLMEHYDIDANDKFKNTKLYNAFIDNITFRRTEFMAVEINVLDKNPLTAALIANDIATLLDSTKIRTQKERAIGAFKIVEKEYLSRLSEIKQMDDSIATLNQLGVYDYESQSEVISGQYAIAIAQGNTKAIKALAEKLKIIADYGSAYVSIRDNLKFEREHLILLKTKYKEAKVDAEEEVSSKFIVNKAYPAEKKSYPIRWLIVVVTAIASFLFAVLLVIAIENVTLLKLQNNSNKAL